MARRHESSPDEDLFVFPFSCISDFQLRTVINQSTDRIKHSLNDNSFKTFVEDTVYQENDLVTPNCHYYDEASFITAKDGATSDLSVFHMNIRSLPKHFTELVAFLECISHKFDVIMLSEIGHCNSQSFSNILRDYDFEFVPPPNKCGGVGIFFKREFVSITTKKNVVSSHLSCQCSNCQVEDLWLVVQHNNKFYLIIVCYRHPKGNVNHFIKALESALLTTDPNTVCIFAGDVNIDLLKCNSISAVKDYLNLMIGNLFTPAITLPTRITASTISLIDHIFVRLPSKLINSEITSGNLYCDISDHLPNFCFISNSSSNLKSTSRPMVRFYSSSNFARFIQSVECTDFSQVYALSDPNDAYNIFVSKITFLHDACFPKTILSRKKLKNKPWITAGIKTSIRRKNLLFRKYIDNPTPEKHAALARYRRVLNKSIRYSKSSYYKRMIIEQQHSSQKTWGVLNELLNRKNKSSPVISSISHNSTIVKDNIGIANAFNDYFSKIGNKLAEDISCDADPMQFLCPSNTKSIFLSPVTEEEISKEIFSLKDGKSPGLDEITSKILKSICHVIVPMLSHIFNLVLTTGVYPDALKVAKVIPIFKKGNRNYPENYRPISLLPSINKLLEKTIEKRLRIFLKDNNTLFDYQFGFRKCHDTSHALLETINCIRTHLDNGENVLGLYLDLKKAFDTVDHRILLQKLYSYGIRGKAYDVISSYLSGRKQLMYVNGVLSNYTSINIGVPQGSVLGPLFFLMYVNDIRNIVPNESVRLFADDTNVFVHDKDCVKLVCKAQAVLSQLKTWFNSNKLTLHLGKTTFSIFHSNESGAHSCPDHFTLNNTKICRTACAKYLGLLIDDKLSFKNHIDDLCNSLVKYNGIFYRLRTSLPLAVAIQLYYSLVYSKISYGIEIFGVVKASILRPLQVLQNRILKTITFSQRRYPTDKLHSNLGILKVSDIHTLRMCTFVFKYVNSKLPQVFCNIVNPRRSSHVPNPTRNNALFSVTRHNSKHGKLLLNNYCYKIWSDLPNDIKLSRSYATFKDKVKSLLIDNYSA